MNRRGSFVTPWVSCPDCRAALAEFDWESYGFEVYPLVGEWPGESAIDSPHPPIVAGRFNGSLPDPGLVVVDLTARLCHPAKLAVIPEEHEAAYSTFYDLGPRR